MGNLATLTFPITKRTQQADGSVMIEGPITDDSLDLDGQIVDAPSAAKALKSWFKDYGNVRQQHSPILAPAGKAMQLDFRDGVPWLKAHIIEPTAVKLTMARVYQAFSIGIGDGELDMSPYAKQKAPNGILYPSLVNEVSITDYPANVNIGKFMIAKRAKDGLIQEVSKVKVFDPRLRGLEGNALVAAFKKIGPPDHIVYTAESPKKARKLIGTQFDAREYEALGSVIVMKRDFDAGVGGGVDRDKIPAKDFADKKNRKYPIVTPGDVSDAASLIGKADNPDAVKARIIAIAQRKGSQFVSELPKKWRNEMGKSQKSKKPAFEGAAEPFKGKSDKDDTTDDTKDAKKTKAAKAEDDTSTAAPVEGENAPAKKSKKDKHMVAEDAYDDKDSKDDDSDDDSDDDAKDGKGMTGKVDKKAAKKSAKAAKKAKAQADAENAIAMKRAHDVLCPVYKGSATKSLTSVIDVINPETFLARFQATAEGDVETRAARKSAYSAAAQIATLEVKDIDTLRRVAHKAFKDAYPDIKVASPDLSDPSSFQRGFLPSATKETATSTSKPSNFPDAKPIAASDFTRGPLTTNQARPSLMGGESMAMKSRTFYTNAAKDSNADAMATLHDHIVDNYPAVCPAGNGIADEMGDRLGTAPEMYSPASRTVGIDTSGANLGGVDSGRAAAAVKAAAREELESVVAPLVKQNKKQQKAIKGLKRKLHKELARPDYSKSANRHTGFKTAADVTPITEGKKERLERVKMLTSRITDRNSADSHDAIAELQDLVSPEEFGRLMTVDNN